MRRLASLAAFWLLTAGSAAAQQGQSSVQGRILDESGLGLPGVVVVVTHQESGMYRQVVSNPDGSYYITGILPGTYRITAELPGFEVRPGEPGSPHRQHDDARHHAGGGGARGERHGDG